MRSCPAKAASSSALVHFGRADRLHGRHKLLPSASTTFDIHLNRRAQWRNVPADVWRYKLGGYQVLKKWLSYREHDILGRPLQPEEVQHFTYTARRIAAILMTVSPIPD